MRILVVSHNVFSNTQSMGKTLSGYFNGFDPDNLAQFYIHSQVPTTMICNHYFRITDKEAIQSIVGVKVGKVFGKNDIEPLRTSERTDSGVAASLYQKARKRTPAIYLTRNLWWKLSHWNSRHLREWLDNFNPECVFFASGDYAFMYEIARKIAVSRRIPLYVSCMDDYYIHNKNSGSFLGRFQHHLFMRSVRKTMACTTALYCICDKMSEDYTSLFQKRCITIHTPSTITHPLVAEKKEKISYLGNVGLQRDKQLIAIGRSLKLLGLNPDHIDVYSTESRKEILDGMTEENGIEFHGAVGADEVLRIMGESMAVIHTESFDEIIRQSVRYSVSTKIADSLASGTCIFAYGPEEIASISYLEKEKAAICCTKPEELSQKLQDLILDTDLRNMTVQNALRLAKMNHEPSRTPERIRDVCGAEQCFSD